MKIFLRMVKAMTMLLLGIVLFLGLPVLFWWTATYVVTFDAYLWWKQSDKDRIIFLMFIYLPSLFVSGVITVGILTEIEDIMKG